MALMQKERGVKDGDRVNESTKKIEVKVNGGK